MNRAKNLINLCGETVESHKPEISRYGKCPPGYKWDSHYKRCFPDDELKQKAKEKRDHE